MVSADAPFVAVENPKMHADALRLIGGLTPRQYVQPWEHGTGHQKATGLYLSPSLPSLVPSHPVEGRQSAMADLSPSPHRGALRSRTYVGIAGAMAVQWMPLLRAHVRAAVVEGRTLVPVSQLLDQAQTSLAERPELSSTEPRLCDPKTLDDRARTAIEEEDEARLQGGCPSTADGLSSVVRETA